MSLNRINRHWTPIVLPILLIAFIVALQCNAYSRNKNVLDYYSRLAFLITLGVSLAGVLSEVHSCRRDVRMCPRHAA